MQIKYQYTLLLMLVAAITACKKDNYDAPSSTLSGRIVYKGEAIGMEYDQVTFQVYQYGFGKVGSFGDAFTQEGAYSLLLFNGQYKFIVPNGQGPFKWQQTPAGAPDSVTITVQGNQTLDMEVTPYYMIRTPELTVSNGKVSGTFKIDKIITDAAAKDIESVSIYINKTGIVSGTDNIAVTNLSGTAITDPNHVTLAVTIPTLVPAQNYIFARIGLKIAGVEDRIFSPVVKLTL
jgi:hypothetical protein